MCIGKPIPYWLYKLHGLNISYNCEICGNFTYKGPKAFQRHFAGNISRDMCTPFQFACFLRVASCSRYEMSGDP